MTVSLVSVWKKSMVGAAGFTGIGGSTEIVRVQL